MKHIQKYKHYIIYIFISSMILIMGCDKNPVDSNDPVVTFPDKNLEKSIRNRLNKLTGDLRKSDLLKIKTLYITSNITNLSGIEYCTELMTLVISTSSISDISPLSKLRKLSWLNLRRNQVSDITPLINLKNLTTLDLSYNKIDNISPLAKLTSLHDIYVKHNSIKKVPTLNNLKNIKNFDLDMNQIDDISPIINIEKFQYLGLSYNRISDLSALFDDNWLTNNYYSTINVQNNPLNDNTINQQIPALIESGLKVLY